MVRERRGRMLAENHTLTLLEYGISHAVCSHALLRLSKRRMKGERFKGGKIPFPDGENPFALCFL